MRLAPSAVNKQPWKIVFDGKAFHFYENHSLAASEVVDIQRVDMGIAFCHFHLAVKEKNLNGHFEKVNPSSQAPAGTDYITSWVIG